MVCPRCGSLIGWERYYSEGHVCDSLHCPKCGWTFDRIIFSNRKASKSREKRERAGEQDARA